ncbi:hypothetical protein Tco_1149010 [Tanacetum coccineum]
MAFRNFIYTEYNKDLVFLPKEPSPGFGTGSPSVSVNTEPLKSNEEPEIQPAEVTVNSGGSPKPELFIVHPGSVAARIKDRKYKTRGGSSKPHVLLVSDNDEGLPDVHKLKDATACHLKISAITPLAWKNHLDNHMDLERSRELLQVIEKLRGECDVMRSRKKAREEECEGLRVKCEDAMTEFEKNPTVVALQEKIFVLSTEVKEHKLNLDRMMLESQKWAGYQQNLSTLESKVTSLRPKRQGWRPLKYPSEKSDAIGSLVGKLVSSAIVYERCRAFKQVVDMKEPFNLSKVKGYRSSYKKEHTQASSDLDTTTFP